MEYNLYFKIITFSILLLNLFNLSVSTEEHDPYSPLILCTLLPEEFIICEDIHTIDTEKNDSSKIGCYPSQFGKQKYEEVEFNSTQCSVIDNTIECSGERTFIRDNIPCIKYTGHSFVTTLLYSFFLGCLGIDRFCLGSPAAIGKLLTLGGLGVWWFVDLILLLTGELVPNDGSSWSIYY